RQAGPSPQIAAKTRPEQPSQAGELAGQRAVHDQEANRHSREGESGSLMRALQSLALKLIRAAIWPGYLLVVAYAARVAAWPRSLGILASAILTAVAIAAFFRALLRWLVWAPPGGERYLKIPQGLARQLDRSGRFLVVAAVALLLPVYLFHHELIAPEGRPV